ncbi:hypothetical protein [Amycolatopsis sp. H20-H5]|uniref:hypothetical protein n=1 Tax=Amycolatopsis sp. H20-H5 TaxID=3046309 RepID=UPI002DB6EF25|nr:hypothetical protein [Amycolatopsis sp. H20-H5]MEC3979916.1 hypothetical protein [Amycolatopsis sp. H20-H5]
MSTTTDFYVGRGPDAEWIGSLQRDCEPDNILLVPPGRLALTTSTESTYRHAVEALLADWVTGNHGRSHRIVDGWPWPWPTSHVSSWIVIFDPGESAVFTTVGGGTRWERIDPADPRQSANVDDELGPPDLHSWLADPAAPPSAPMPRMLHPAPGNPCRHGAAL